MHDKEKLTEEWFIIGTIAFIGGVVANVIVPSRRGTLGFAGAALIGVFCGGVSGICANSFGAAPGLTYLIAAISAVLGDRVLSGVLAVRQMRTVHVHTQVNGSNQQNISQEGGDANQD